MRIIVLNDKRAEREAVVKALPQATYCVEAVGDEQAAVAAIMRDAPQVVLFSASAKGGQALARRLRGADASGQAYLIALFDNTLSSREIATVVDGGAHDFMRRPVVEAELLARLKAPVRLLRWARAVARPAAFDLSAPVDVPGLQAWEALGALVAADISQLAGQPLVCSPGWPAHFDCELHGATIPMSLAGDGLEVRISMVVDSTTLSWVRETLLGDVNADAQATDDVLRELANTAGGALKRAALAESVTLTTGIPRTDAQPRYTKEHSCWTLASDGGRGCLALIGEIRKRENRRVPTSELSEGMVLAHDAHNEGGLLLVPAGTRLTSTTAAKLAKVLGSRFFLEVVPTL